jgi:hypothetical protein
MIEVVISGVTVFVQFTPSLKIKTTDKRLELMLRSYSCEVYDPIQKTLRVAKLSKSLYEAYLVLEEMRILLPEAQIEFKQTPEFFQPSKSTSQAPALY